MKEPAGTSGQRIAIHSWENLSETGTQAAIHLWATEHLRSHGHPVPEELQRRLDRLVVAWLAELDEQKSPAEGEDC